MFHEINKPFSGFPNLLDDLAPSNIKWLSEVDIFGAESLPGSYPAAGCGRHEISLHAVAGAAAAAELGMKLGQQLMSLSAGWLNNAQII